MPAFPWVEFISRAFKDVKTPLKPKCFLCGAETTTEGRKAELCDNCDRVVRA